MTAHSQYEPCEECGAPLDPQQRYCVHCAARRGNGANPSSRYFAAMSKRARRPPARVQAKATGSRAAAVGFFALLPIAVAIGVVVGRTGSGEDNSAVVQALREQNAALANSGSAQAGTAAASGPKSKNAAKQAKKAAAKSGGKVIAHTPNGTVHQIAGFKPSKQQTEEDTKIVENSPEQTGSNYVKAQQGLPDVIVVGGSSGSAPAASGGNKGEP
jgi:hypothetical protein